MHDRGEKVIAISRHTVERLSTLVKRLVGRAILDQVLATGRSLATNGIDQRPFNVPVTDFQTYFIGPARQFFQRMQRQPFAVS
ncbi:hypothetical protein D9M71_805530 [compost metagenome]